MAQATTTNTIAALRRVFSYFGLPELLSPTMAVSLQVLIFRNF